MGCFKQFPQYIGNIFSGEKGEQHFVVIIIVLLCVSIGISMMPLKSSGGHAVLFSNLVEQDATLIKDMLEKKGVDYIKTADETAILVPKEMVRSLRWEVISYLEPYHSKPYEKTKDIN